MDERWVKLMDGDGDSPYWWWTTIEGVTTAPQDCMMIHTNVGSFALKGTPEVLLAELSRLDEKYAEEER